LSTWSQSSFRHKDQKLGVTCAGIKYRPHDLINAFTKFGRPEEEEDVKLSRLISTTLVVLVLEQVGLLQPEEEDTVAQLAVIVYDLLGSLPCNTHAIGEMVMVKDDGKKYTGEIRPFGLGLFSTMSLMNHSCLPNIARWPSALLPHWLLSRLNTAGSWMVAVASRNIRWKEGTKCRWVSSVQEG
jgi:hypothetical protein